MGERRSRFNLKDNFINLFYLCSGLYKDPNSGKIVHVMDRVKVR